VSRTAGVSIDERVLVQRCRAGDSAAAERLILKYQNRVFNVILRMCGNVDDAAELTQDTFVRVIENIDKFEGRSSFYTWMFRIAFNLTLNFCSRNVLRMRSLDADDEAGFGRSREALGRFLADEGLSDPAQTVADRELAELALKALARLGDDQRTVIVLRDIEGMLISSPGRLKAA